MNLKLTRKKLLFTTLSLFSIIGYGVFVFAAPPGTGGYNPGETLDPECTPGQVLPNPCIVKLPLTTADSGLTVTGSNVQLGGALIQDTNIDLDGHNLTTTGTSGNIDFATTVAPGLTAHIQASDDIMGLSGVFGVNIKGAGFFTQDTAGNFGVIFSGDASATGGDGHQLEFSTQNFTTNKRVGMSVLGDSNTISLSISDGSIGLNRQVNFDANGIHVQGATSGYTLPWDDGTANQVLTTDGAGQLSWQNAGGSGANIYNSDGTLTGNRTVTQNGNDLNFITTTTGARNSTITNTVNGIGLSNADPLNPVENLNMAAINDSGVFFSSVQNTGADVFYTAANFEPTKINMWTSSFVDAYSNFNMDQYLSTLEVGSSPLRSGYNIRDSKTDLYTVGNGSGDEVHLLTDQSGITFQFKDGLTSVISSYLFPKIDGTANQVLTTDGAGQLSWQNAGGGSSLKWYSENATAPTTAPVATGSGSIALGDGAEAVADFMFVYGSQAGVGAANAAGSNFFGENAGQDAVSASSSNFFGESAGTNATNASYSNFFGDRAGTNAANANNSNFLGNYAGNGATNAFESNFFGTSAGQDATSASDSIFIGRDTGRLATNANKSVFLMYGAGAGATNANNSIFIGEQAGEFALNANNANFFGTRAGSGAEFAYRSNFLGSNAGDGATEASDSNFLGSSAGLGASHASASNFIGYLAGANAVSANNSNFFGGQAGYGAEYSRESNFIGHGAGYSAVYATYSQFIGSEAGFNATNAAQAIFIGNSAGFGDSVNNTGNIDNYSILLGNNTSTGGFSNSIAIGSFATNTSSNQFMIGSTTRPIDTLVLTGAGGNTCILDVTIASLSCSSDEALKTNITDLSTTTLENLLKVKTVTYNWKNYPDKELQIGFLAQDLEQYFPEIVSVAPNGFKTVSYGGMTPILVEAIREMNLNVTQLSDMTRTNTWRDSLIAWFESSTNGINNLFAKRVHVEQLCVGSIGNETCLTKDQVDNILNSTNTTLYVPPVIITPPANDPGVNTGTDDTSIDPGTDIESVPPTENTPPVDQPSTPPVDIPTE